MFLLNQELRRGKLQDSPPGGEYFSGQGTQCGCRNIDVREYTAKISMFSIT